MDRSLKKKPFLYETFFPVASSVKVVSVNCLRGIRSKEGKKKEEKR